MNGKKRWIRCLQGKHLFAKAKKRFGTVAIGYRKIKKRQLKIKWPILNVDIKDKTVLEQPRTDIIVGTYPCTKYSAIADIHGTRTGDDLFLHFFDTLLLKQKTNRESDGNEFENGKLIYRTLAQL